MTSNLLSDNKSNLEHNAKRLDLFSLIWLDDNSKDNRSTEKKLGSTINDLKKFQDVSLCQQYIEKMSKDNRVVLIVNGHLGKKLVPFIHKLQQVSLIYVYCEDKKTNEQWTCQYSKVA